MYGVRASTSWINVALGSVDGFAVYRPSISDKIINASASIMLAMLADNVSLSPILNSSIATTSFSLIIGITPNPMRAVNVFRRFR